MKRICLILLSAVILITSGCSTSESFTRPGYNFAPVEKVAVIKVSGNIRGEAVKTQINDYFVMELMKKGYVPIERDAIDNLLKEQDFQNSNLTSTQNAAQVGQILNVPAVFMINVPSFNEKVTITAKLVDVSDGSILWMGSGNANTGKTLMTIAGVVGGAIVGSQFSHDHKSAAAIGGGVLGGLAGNVLTPQEDEMIKELIGKICSTIPDRAPAISMKQTTGGM